MVEELVQEFDRLLYALKDKLQNCRSSKSIQAEVDQFLITMHSCGDPVGSVASAERIKQHKCPPRQLHPPIFLRKVSEDGVEIVREPIGKDRGFVVEGLNGISCDRRCCYAGFREVISNKSL